MFVAFGASAQFLSFGVKAGLNMASLSDTDNSKMKVGFKVGPTMELAVAPSMSFQTALLLSSRGVDFDEGDGTISANYLELPVTFAYKYPIAPDTRIYGNVGPYFAYGIYGDSKGYSGNKFDTFGDEGILENFDFGFTIGVGMEITKLNFGLNYDLGLTNCAKEGDASPKNRNFWISVGYKF
jgi:hypothetical protein